MTYLMHKSQMVFVGEVQGHLAAGGVSVPFSGHMYRRAPVEDPVQHDPPQPKHHDHLIQRHIRSPIRK